MERARWKNNKIPIEADELPDLYEMNPNLNESDFICIGCDGESTACSYKPENKRRPYFRVDARLSLHKGTKSDKRFKSSLIL